MDFCSCAAIPYYLSMTTDWDFPFPDPGDAVLLEHGRLRMAHPALRYTMFVGPYTFTDPDLTEARRAQIVTWLQAQRDQHGDELALHIHPWCNFVAAAGASPRGQRRFHSAAPADSTTRLSDASQSFATREPRSWASANASAAESSHVRYVSQRPTSAPRFA